MRLLRLLENLGNGGCRLDDTRLVKRGLQLTGGEDHTGSRSGNILKFRGKLLFGGAEQGADVIAGYLDIFTDCNDSITILNNGPRFPNESFRPFNSVQIFNYPFVAARTRLIQIYYSSFCSVIFKPRKIPSSTSFELKCGRQI